MGPVHHIILGELPLVLLLTITLLLFSFLLFNIFSLSLSFFPYSPSTITRARPITFSQVGTIPRLWLVILQSE